MEEERLRFVHEHVRAHSLPLQSVTVEHELIVSLSTREPKTALVSMWKWARSIGAPAIHIGIEPGGVVVNAIGRLASGTPVYVGMQLQGSQDRVLRGSGLRGPTPLVSFGELIERVAS